ncbi:folate-binding protein, partial [Candidatus Pelagibacter sp.]|nr:folate-binding protein [Candidatus Pelagibacter sp.]
LLAIQLISGKLTEGASIYAKDIEVGKVLINDEYPFALIKYLDENFKKDSELKSENAILRIKMPKWI